VTPWYVPIKGNGDIFASLINNSYSYKAKRSEEEIGNIGRYTYLSFLIYISLILLNNQFVRFLSTRHTLKGEVFASMSLSLSQAQTGG
jgi:hypothetical protein